ncbi:MAG: hypothetical protein IJF29_03835 [Firmicutes bacterium]|nr:hypothetical protein [Bacillota bacterium]
MKKRVLKDVLTMVLCLVCALQAYASDGSQTVQPRYRDIMAITYSFDIEDGEAYYGSTVVVDTGEEIEIYMELQEDTDTGWETVKESSRRRYTSTLTFDDSCEVDPNGSYRVYYEITDWYSGGTETVTHYKYY